MVSRRSSLALIFTLVAPFTVAQSTSAHADDRIYDEVRRILANDVDVKGAGFEVAVKNGVVTLNGRVHTEKAKIKATTLTKKVKGVVSVDNQLKMFGVDD
jgi:osmotically-inducible protein OsmY